MNHLIKQCIKNLDTTVNIDAINAVINTKPQCQFGTVC